MDDGPRLKELGLGCFGETIGMTSCMYLSMSTKLSLCWSLVSMLRPLTASYVLCVAARKIINFMEKKINKIITKKN